VQTADYCREIETYLCQKNDGHLIRVVGPSFELVTRWAAEGVPLKIAFRGIDRYFERYYRKGPRRRPVRIDFCEADVLDVFDEWRRAVGITATHLAGSGDASTPAESPSVPARRGVSLPAHLERVVTRLTNARATGTLGSEADRVIDRVARELDSVRSSAHGLRGEARQSVLERLNALDAELLRMVRATIDEGEQRAFQRDAEEQLAGFRSTMPAEAFERAREAAVDRLVREHLGLPILSFS